MMPVRVPAELAAFCAAIETATLPPDVVARARLLVTDLIGCIVRAQVESPAATSLYASAKALGLSEGPYRVFGDERTHGSAGATFLNAALAHSLDLAATHSALQLHTVAPVPPQGTRARESAGPPGAGGRART